MAKNNLLINVNALNFYAACVSVKYERGFDRVNCRRARSYLQPHLFDFLIMRSKRRREYIYITGFLNHCAVPELI